MKQMKLSWPSCCITVDLLSYTPPLLSSMSSFFMSRWSKLSGAADADARSQWQHVHKPKITNCKKMTRGLDFWTVSWAEHPKHHALEEECSHEIPVGLCSCSDYCSIAVGQLLRVAFRFVWFVIHWWALRSAQNVFTTWKLHQPSPDTQPSSTTQTEADMDVESSSSPDIDSLPLSLPPPGPLTNTFTLRKPASWATLEQSCAAICAA